MDCFVNFCLTDRNWHYGNSFAYWVGGEYNNRLEYWQWIGKGGGLMNYLNWEILLPGYKKQPDNPISDSCVDLEMRYIEGKKQHYGWYDTRCDHMQFFICELT